MTTKVILVPDIKGWAWWYMAQDIKAFAPPEYEVTVIESGAFRYGRMTGGPYKALLYFSWPEAPTNLPIKTKLLLASEGALWQPEDFSDKDWRPAVCTNLRNAKRARHVFSKVDGVLAVNPVLHASAVEAAKTSACYPAGTNTTFFQPRAPLGAKERLQVGWCGQVCTDLNQPDNRRLIKGYDRVLLPLMEACKDFCEFHVNTHGPDDALPRNDMLDFYNSIDVFICTSLTEGTPMPALEAMSCGRPVLSTPVGDMIKLSRWVTHEMLVPGYKNDRHTERAVKYFARSLREFHENRDILSKAGQEARRVIEGSRNWETLSGKWLDWIIGGA